MKEHEKEEAIKEIIESITSSKKYTINKAFGIEEVTEQYVDCKKLAEFLYEILHEVLTKNDDVIK